MHYPANVVGTDSTRFTYTSVYPGQLHQVVDPLGNSYTHSYTNRGELSQRTFPGSGSETLTYDTDGRLKQRQVFTSSQGTFVNQSLRHDARGRMVQMSGSGITTSALNWYSGLGNLIATDVDKTTGSLSYLEEFKVDALGSVLERQRHGPSELPYQSTYMGEQLTHVEAIRSPWAPADGLVANDTYNHFELSTGDVHASGTITEVSQGGVYQESARMTSHSYFSGDGRLIAHQRYASETGTGERWGVWEEYRYDALGRRVMVRTARPDTLCNVVNCYGSITRYVWEGDQILLEMRAPGGPSDNMESTIGSMPRFGRVAYVHAGGIDRPLALIRSASSVGEFLVVPHTDWRGQFDRGTNSSGQHFDNRPGEPPIDWPGRDRLSYGDEETNTQPLGSWYGGLIQDMKDESGLAYRRNRYYDPNTGRFTQQDPIGLAGGLSLYGYASGDPVTFTDPFGLCPWCIGAFVGFAVEGVSQIATRKFDPAALATSTVIGGLSGGLSVATGVRTGLRFAGQAALSVGAGMAQTPPGEYGFSDAVFDASLGLLGEGVGNVLESVNASTEGIPQQVYRRP